MLNIGEPAPAFSAESTMGRIELADALGKRPVVLIFYPKDDTPICTAQLCAVRDSRAQYERFDALVIGVNPGTVESHRKFAAKHRYDFPLVADEGERIRRLYGVDRQWLRFLGQQRVVYVIDKRGKIAYARKGNRPTAELISVLESIESRDSK